MASPASSPMGSSNAEAGPSRAPANATLPPDQEELERIQASMSHRHKSSHRRASIFSSVSKKTHSTRRKVASVVKRDEDEEGMYEGMSEEERAEAERKVFEEEDHRAAVQDWESRRDPIVYHEPVNQEEGQERGPGSETAGASRKPEFVWDVLFENQRGIYLLGKAHFSNRSLLPADPSPFTVPAHALPSASSITVAQPNSPDGPQVKHVQSKSSGKDEDRRSIETGYTLDTFQAPSPAWKWIGPWMVNMRPGTDEAGWTYNYLFKKNGWKSHAGAMGWGGWVRRREWNRLRCLDPEVEVSEAPKEPEEHVAAQQSIEELLKDNEHGVETIVKAMSKIPLDRQRLETWQRWLEQGDPDKLQNALGDDQAVQTLSKAFTYHSTASSFKSLLAAHHLFDPSAAHTPSSSSSRLPGTPTSPTAAGYTVSPPRIASMPTSKDAASASPAPDTDD